MLMPVSYTLSTQHVLGDRALPLSVARVPVSWPVSDHGHEFQEIVYVERGRATHEVSLVARGETRRGRAQRYPLLPGDCFLVAPGEHHAFIAPRSLVVWNIIFLPSLYQADQEALRLIPGLCEFLFIEPMFRHEGRAATKLHLEVRARAPMVSFLELMATELTTRQEGWMISARAHFLAMLVHVARSWTRSHAQSEHAGARTAQRQVMDETIAFMEEHYGEDLSLRTIAEQALLSPHHFSETFKRHCGMPPWEYLLTLRLERGKELLRTTTRSVTDIALSVGFGDSSYFARVFKADTGTTPRSWRAQQGVTPTVRGAKRS
jgi:AraC-like DNA-binding protein